MIRPLRCETLRYGDVSTRRGVHLRPPVPVGQQAHRPGPARVGGKYPNLWHYPHMMDPRATSPGSNMPPYAWLAERADRHRRSRRPKLALMQKLGVPYTNADIDGAEAAERAGRGHRRRPRDGRASTSRWDTRDGRADRVPAAPRPRRRRQPMARATRRSPPATGSLGRSRCHVRALLRGDAADLRCRCSRSVCSSLVFLARSCGSAASRRRELDAAARLPLRRSRAKRCSRQGVDDERLSDAKSPGQGAIHEYDGIHEYDNQLPNWWLATLFGASSSPSATGSTTITRAGPRAAGARCQAETSGELARRAAPKPARSPTTSARSALVDRTRRSSRSGKQLFTTTCAACHGADGQGLVGPNLTDEYWLHGGDAGRDPRTDHQRRPGEGDARLGAGARARRASQAVAAYVLTLRGTNLPGKAAAGRAPVESP